MMTIAMQICLQKIKNILNYNHGEKAMKIPFNIYADMEYLLEKIDKCQSNLGKSSTTKINEHATYVACSFILVVDDFPRLL